VSESPAWEVCVQAERLEHELDWDAIEVTLAAVDQVESFVEEVIYFDNSTGEWLPDMMVVSGPEQGWDVHWRLFEPANIITPGLLYGLFEDDLEAGATVHFQPTVADTYDCDDCRDDPEAQAAGQCDHTLGWVLVWAIQPPATPTVQRI
jgi:hypothetical protein